MEELIWFSIPGAVMAIAIGVVWYPVFGNELGALVLGVLAPVIGFIVHQSSRLLFEGTGGYAQKSRTVLHYISDVLAPRENVIVPNLERAFLVWEITFYGEDFPAPFRDHDRVTWHYLHSFWGITLSAVLSPILCIVGCFGYFASSPIINVLGVVLGEVLIAVIFALKGRSTYHSLIKQETAMAQKHKELFLATLRKLKDGESGLVEPDSSGATS